jgi:hypothetical protein
MNLKKYKMDIRSVWKWLQRIATVA